MQPSMVSGLQQNQSSQSAQQQQQHLSHGQLKPGVSLPNSSPQVRQAGSPQINQHSSPQNDQQKSNSATSNAANIIQQQTLKTPGAALITFPGKSGATYQPFERLFRVVKPMSSTALNSAVGDIVSVMIDKAAGSAPGNGSRAAVGEDLVAMKKFHLQARNFITRDGSGMKRLKCYTNAMPLNDTSSVGSPNNSFKQLTGSETSELESNATASVKRRIEVNPDILEEIKENERLIDTVVDISDEDVDPTPSAVAVEVGEGTVVKCTFSAMSLIPNLKSQMPPIQPLRLLVPANYPNCSPILLDKFPVEVSKEYDDLSAKVKSRFSISLTTLSRVTTQVSEEDSKNMG